MHDSIRDKSLSIIKMFNGKPKSGIAEIKRIYRSEDIQDVAEQIAEFFIAGKDSLDLEAVGDYISGPENMNKAVLEKFVRKMDFKGQPFPKAMRSFLKAFKLPGEAQKIERLLDAFSSVYCEQNPDHPYISGSYEASVLAYAVIMLQTDLHNPSVKEHMTVEQFQRNLRDCNRSGPTETEKDFDKRFLEEIYTEIEKEPFKMNFIKTPPGIEFNSLLLKYDNTFKGLLAFIDSDKGDITKIFDLPNRELTAEFNEPMPFLASLTGYKGTITITDNNAPGHSGSATVQIYQPSVFSRVLFGDEPSVIIQPGNLGNMEDSLKLTGELAASFRSVTMKISATFDYEKEDMIKAFSNAIDNGKSR